MGSSHSGISPQENDDSLDSVADYSPVPRCPDDLGEVSIDHENYRLPFGYD